MAFTVFYSWQSDIAGSINRNFIEDALKKSIDKLGKDLLIQEALRDSEIKIDKDTQGVPGIPPIVDVIFEKISRCGIFVPDLTFVGQTRGGRLLPNPNVLVEYGWALKEVTNSRIIPVMNAAFGEPSSETLPFDMRHLRFPLTYYLKEDAAPEERKKVKEELVNKLTSAMALIVSNKLVPLESEQFDSIKETPYTTDPSTFLEKGEPFAQIHLFHGPEETIYLPDVERLFLRIIPSAPVDQIMTTKAALDMAKKGNLSPMGEHPGGTYGRNRFGAFVCNHNEGKVLNLTQLFKNGELWGINAYCIDKKLLVDRAKIDFGFFPCVALEDCFISSLANYLQFSKNVLKLPLPIRFIAGATNVKGYRMTAPTGMHFGGFEKFAGSVVEQHITYDGKIENYDEKVTDILRPFFNHIWEECGLDRPDKEYLR